MPRFFRFQVSKSSRGNLGTMTKRLEEIRGRLILCCELFQGQRTVYRLTLVKSWNSEELQNYADLVSIGKPDFIEVKVICIRPS